MYSGTPRPQKAAELFGQRARSFRADHVSNKSLRFGRIATNSNDGIAHEWMSSQIRLNLTRLDPNAAKLDLKIQPTEIFNRAIG